MSKQSLNSLLVEIRACQFCADKLPHGPRPVLSAGNKARILIVGQAPGIKVHRSGKAWDDPSGRRLRDWMAIDETDFYDSNNVALVPMGFCFPGAGKTGDLPPRPECAELWHDRLLKQLTAVRLTLVVGQYAQARILGQGRKPNLTQTVAAWNEFVPRHLPLPHPSPRNNRWLRNNPWFESDVLPWLKQRVARLLR